MWEFNYCDAYCTAWDDQHSTGVGEGFFMLLEQYLFRGTMLIAMWNGQSCRRHRRRPWTERGAVSIILLGTTRLFETLSGLLERDRERADQLSEGRWIWICMNSRAGSVRRRSLTMLRRWPRHALLVNDQ